MNILLFLSNAKYAKRVGGMSAGHGGDNLSGLIKKAGCIAYTGLRRESHQKADVHES